MSSYWCQIRQFKNVLAKQNSEADLTTNFNIYYSENNKISYPALFIVY